MAGPTEKPYGLWTSPLTPAGMAGVLRLGGVAFDADGQRLVWLEGRSGQGVLVATVDMEAPRDITTDVSVRARVGYGGGDFTVGEGVVYFVADGRLYRQSLATGAPRALTPRFGQVSSPQVSPDGRWLLFVHSDEDVDVIAVVDAEGRQWPRRLVSGHDFFMWPRWSPRGDAIAYVAWDHPAMPWDETRLYLAPIVEWSRHGPELGEPTVVAGGEGGAVAQPEFAPDGRRLAYIADATGWNQLYVFDRAANTATQVTTALADHGGPAWSYEQRSYAWHYDGQGLVYRRDARGFQRLWTVDLASGEHRPVPGEAERYTAIDSVTASPATHEVAFIGSASAIPPRVVMANLTSGAARVLRRSAAESVAEVEYAGPQALTWTAPDGEAVYGLYYPPTNPRFTASGPAPLVVLVHGGPTGHERADFSDRVQFLATRGYAVLVPNYRGSTGYGRAYMERLRANWGICDVADSISGAQHLVELGRAHPGQIVIMGGSAGGYTVLQALIEQPRFFKAGICLYGVADHFALASDTHKFEAHYLDSLLGPLPEAAAIYRERSPVFHADRITTPLAVFQGEEDTVVPKSQSDAIVESLRRRGVPHEYHVYPGEGHGWRKRETIEAFYTALESFLRRYVIFA